MYASSSSPDLPPSILRYKPFAFFWFARGFGSIAFQIQGVAVGWQVYALTGSPFYLGLVGLAQFLPMFLLTLAVGHVADRYDRRMLVRLCHIVEGLAAAGFAFGSFSGWENRERNLVVFSPG